MGLMDTLKEKANEVLKQAEEEGKTVASDKINQAVDQVKARLPGNPEEQGPSSDDPEDTSN